MKGECDMTWITKTPYKPIHQCSWPDLEVEKSVGAGSVWECDECERRFIVVEYEGVLMWVRATGGALKLRQLMEDGVA